MTPEDRAERTAAMKARFAALPPEEQKRRLDNLLSFCADEDADDIEAMTDDEVRAELVAGGMDVGRGVARMRTFVDGLLARRRGDPQATITAANGSVRVFHLGEPDRRTLMLDAAERRGITDLAASATLDAAGVDALIAKLTAWKNEPRDAARAAAEVVAEDDGVRLLKTSTGEWGVQVEHEIAGAWAEAEWHTYEATARGMYAGVRGKVPCECCSAEIDEDDAINTPDDVPVCPAYADGLAEEFKATRFRCVAITSGVEGDSFVTRDVSCGWDGTGAEVTHEGICPKCKGEIDEVRDNPSTEIAPATEATAP